MSQYGKCTSRHLQPAKTSISKPTHAFYYGLRWSSVDANDQMIILVGSAGADQTVRMRWRICRHWKHMSESIISQIVHPG